jgi:WD40 repeat-containing protein SMU1
MSIEIESQDVIRVVLQFLKEHNLNDSMQSLQRESGITLNTVDNIDHFANDIRNGKWDSVLNQTAALKLPGDKLVRCFLL